MRTMKSRLSPSATMALTGAAVVAVIGGLALARSPRIRSLSGIRALSATDAIRKFQRAKRTRQIKRAVMGGLKSAGVG